MRKIKYKTVVEEVEKIIYEANFSLPEDLLEKIKKEKDNTKNLNKEILNLIIENAAIAKEKEIPLCQDCGIGVFFVEIGNKVMIEGGSLKKALNEATKNVYQNYYLRKSVVEDPLRRNNTNTNIPAIIHFDFIEGDRLKIAFLAKGGGSENMSKLKMFNPSVPKKEIYKFILDTVIEAGPNPCPPIILGIGMGGTFDSVTKIAKKSLLRKIGERNNDKDIAKMEKEITSLVNEKSKVGIQGLGGKLTVLDTFIETKPCHIASFPVAVNINCHSARHKKVII